MTTLQEIANKVFNGKLSIEFNKLIEKRFILDCVTEYVNQTGDINVCGSVSSILEKIIPIVIKQLNQEK